MVTPRPPTLRSVKDGVKLPVTTFTSPTYWSHGTRPSSSADPKLPGLPATANTWPPNSANVGLVEASMVTATQPVADS